MNIRLLGTGAADGIPSPFGDDKVSQYARENGGKDVRSRSAAIVDGVLKIDLGPDTNMQMQRDRLDAREWSAVIYTHSDDDHFAVNEIQYALFPFTQHEYLPYTIYANATILAQIEARYPNWPIELVETRSFQTFHHAGYAITPVRARHIHEEDCHNLVIERDGKAILYATDTGVYSEETFRYLGNFQLDALVIECTDGFCATTYEGHLDFKEVVMVVNRLREQGTLRADSQVVTTHHATRGEARHCDLERAFRPHGIEPGYDGMLLEI